MEDYRFQRSSFLGRTAFPLIMMPLKVGEMEAFLSFISRQPSSVENLIVTLTDWNLPVVCNFWLEDELHRKCRQVNKFEGNAFFFHAWNQRFGERGQVCEVGFIDFAVLQQQGDRGPGNVLE